MNATIKPVGDAIGYVRRHPEMFFPGQKPNPLTCIQHLVMEILSLGADDVRLCHHEGWWMVSSNHDWFVGLSEQELFTRIIPLPQVGANACRVEIVLGAYAESIVTIDPMGTRHPVQGVEPGEDVWSMMTSPGARSLAFRFA